MLPRACVFVAAGLCSVVVAVAPATAKMYVSTSVVLDDGGAAASGHAEGYATVSTTGGSGQPVLSLSTDTIRLDVVRSGATVETVTGAAGTGFAQLGTFVAQTGDELVVTDVDTSETHTVTYTGAPALDWTGCGGRFAGVRDDGATVGVTAAATTGETASKLVVASGAGTTFSGGFSQPLSTAWSVTATETRALEAGATPFSAFADVTRTVATACPPVAAPAPPPVVTTPAAPAPAPAAPAAPVKDLLAPSGVLKLRVADAYRALVGGTFADAVTITEAGTVTQTLYLDGGGHKATILGKGRAVVRKAGRVSVRITLSAKGRSHLKSARTTKVTLVTTVADAAGNARVLAPHRFTLKRGR